MDAGIPEGLVRVDVSDPCRRALVEESRLDRRPAPGESRREGGGREAAGQRLGAQPPRREVVVQLARLDELPRPEATDVPVGDVRAIV
jgi:hypothetical protein